MTEKIHSTPLGEIHYWVNNNPIEEAKTLVFLPGLAADHTLFVHQIEYFSAHYNVLVWDAPAHGKSRPFQLAFDLEDIARYLHEILTIENVEKAVLVGQSLGGYISQMYMELYPAEVSHFVSIDSAPLQRQYYQNWEIWMLKHTKTMYLSIPWKILMKWGAYGVSQTAEGRVNMKAMMTNYERIDYCNLVSFGYLMLAKAVEQNRPYNITCPVLLLCGDHDQAGSCKRYSNNWTEKTGFPLLVVPNAGHNSNIDNPEFVNKVL